MGTGLEKLRARHWRLLHLALFGSVVGSVIAYPLLTAAKLMWGLPDQGWWRVALGPVFMFGLLIVELWLGSRQDLRDAQRIDDLD